MLAVEGAGDHLQALARQALTVHFQSQLQRLALIADVRLVVELLQPRLDALAGQRLAHLAAQLVEDLHDLVEFKVGDAADDRARGFILHPSGGVTVGAEHTGARRDDYRPGVHQDAHGIGVQRTGAAEAAQGEIARIVALLDTDQAQRAVHVFVGQAHDAFSGLEQRHAHGVGNALHRGGRQVMAHLEVAAKLLHARQVAQHHVGVGYRGQLAATVVGGWAGYRTGTSGPTRRARVSSGTLAMEPPPAPTVRTSTEGARTATSPTRVSRRMRAWLLSIRA